MPPRQCRIFASCFSCDSLTCPLGVPYVCLRFVREMKGNLRCTYGSPNKRHLFHTFLQSGFQPYRSKFLYAYKIKFLRDANIFSSGAKFDSSFLTIFYALIFTISHPEYREWQSYKKNKLQTHDWRTINVKRKENGNINCVKMHERL